MQSVIKFIWWLCLFASSISAQKTVGPARLDYTGSSTVGNFIGDANKVYTEAIFALNTSPESAGGELAIMEGRTDLAGIARVPSESILNKGIASKLIGWDAIAVVIHPDNPVKQLTQSQLKGIFTGAIHNWNELGGPDLKINPYVVGIESATRKIFRSAILGPLDYSGCQEISPDIDILEEVGNDPGGIGHISFSFVNGAHKVKPIDINGQHLSLSNKDYPITRPLYLLWWPGREDVASFVEWVMTREGQRLIMQRFIGAGEAHVQYSERKGSLIVYTPTSTVEDGGIYYYPHKPYDIFTIEGKLIMTVKNHFSINDENPAIVELYPGDYIIRTSANNNKRVEYFVSIKADKTTKLFAASGESELKEAGGQGIQNANIPPPESLNPVKDMLSFFGDFRVRAEQDYRNTTDRFRGRFRIRAGMSARLGRDARFGFRLVSTADPNDPNSTHVDLTEGFNQIQVAIDRAYLQLQPARLPFLQWWLGKFTNPNLSSGIFSELVWDADIQPEGTALALNIKLNQKHKLVFTNGSYLLSQFSEGDQKNWLNNTQLALMSAVSPSMDMTLAAGLYYFVHIKDLEIGNSFLDANGGNSIYGLSEIINGVPVNTFHYATDFHIFESFMLLKYNQLAMPLEFKFQWINNLGATDNNLAFAAGISYGDLKSRNQWKIFYQYHHIQQDAIFTPFAQDDALANSNTKGHVLGMAYNFHRAISLQAWGLFDTALDEEAQSQSRYRLDLNIKF